MNGCRHRDAILLMEKDFLLTLLVGGRQLVSNVKTSLPKICQFWTKYFIRAHCTALDKTNVFANYLLSLIADETLAPLEAGEIAKNEQLEAVVIHSNLEPYINFYFNNSRERFFL
ncbi:hypothetical protein P9112_005777 [Eukaryota sp. TZLM1-RC]